MRIFIIISTLFIGGCFSIKQCEEKSKIVIKGEYPVLTTPDSAKWSIVTIHTLSENCRKDKLFYEGSFNQYHLIRFWIKMSPAPNAEVRFAVDKSEYQPDSIYQYVDPDKVDWSKRRYIKPFPKYSPGIIR